MPTTGVAFDPTVAAPPTDKQSGYFKTLSDTGVEAANTETDYATQSGRMEDKYNDVLKPQLQGSVATQGNWYSNPGQDQLGQQAVDYTNAQSDLRSTVQRHLDSLTSQRNWASVGLV
jgi:hypothetical protein